MRGRLQGMSWLPSPTVPKPCLLPISSKFRLCGDQYQGHERGHLCFSSLEQR